MIDRLEFATRLLAQAAADELHQRMIAADPNYAKSVQLGHTTAWAIPYQDEKTLVWCVNVKDRGRVAVAPADLPKLKPFSDKVVAVEGPKVK